MGGGGAAPGQPGAQMMGAPPVPQKKSMLWIVVVAVIAIVVVAAVVGALVIMNSINHVGNGDIDMTVTSSATVSASDYTIAPAAGDKYVQITVHMKNNGDLPLVASSVFFKLEVSGSSTDYVPTPYVTSDTDSLTLQTGASGSFTVSFEVPSGATPDKITYNGIFGSAEANIP